MCRHRGRSWGWPRGLDCPEDGNRRLSSPVEMVRIPAVLLPPVSKCPDNPISFHQRGNGEDQQGPGKDALIPAVPARARGSQDGLSGVVAEGLADGTGAVGPLRTEALTFRGNVQNDPFRARLPAGSFLSRDVAWSGTGAWIRQVHGEREGFCGGPEPSQTGVERGRRVIISELNEGCPRGVGTASNRPASVDSNGIARQLSQPTIRKP